MPAPQEGTAVDEINAAQPHDGLYYNLMGIPVDKPTKGIYIRNGKKVYIL